MIEGGKYLLLEDKYDRAWQFIKDDETLQEYLKDGSLDDGDLIIEVRVIHKAVQKKYIELEEVKE